MRVHRALLATALAVAATAFGGAAYAWVPPTGPACHLDAGPDASPDASPDAYFGVLRAGPLVATGTTMSVACTVQIGGTGLYGDPDVASAGAGPSANAVALAPTLVAFLDPGLPVWVCTHVHQVDALNVATDLYWDAPSQSWTPLGLAATCESVPMPSSAVLGGIAVYHYASTNPSVLLAAPFGVLADPNLWSCTIPGYVASQPFAVTCTPVSLAATWTCGAVIAAAVTYSGAGTVRTAADCDGGAPEAQTTTVSGPLAWDVDATVPGVAATTFTCELDDGGTAGPVPDYAGFCFDPGLVYVR